MQPPLAHTRTHTRTHTHTQEPGYDASYWTAPHFLACTIYEAVDGQQHIESCVERGLLWLAEGLGAEGGQGVLWLVWTQTIESGRLLYWMAAALGGVWMTLLRKKTNILRVLCLYWSFNCCGWTVWRYYGGYILITFEQLKPVNLWLILKERNDFIQ